MSSLFVAPGTNAREGQVNQQKTVAHYPIQAIDDWLGPLLEQQAEFASGNEPGREAAINRELYLASPGNAAARQAEFANNAFSNASRAARVADAQNKSAGISPAYSAGQNTAITNAANDAANKNWANMNSPEYQLAQANALLSQYQGAMGMPSLSNYSQLANIVYGRPQVPVGKGVGDYLGQLGGSLAGDWLGAFGSAGSSSSGPAPNPGYGVGGNPAGFNGWTGGEAAAGMNASNVPKPTSAPNVNNNKWLGPLAVPTT